jgi:hypothetical protein
VVAVEGSKMKYSFEVSDVQARVDADHELQFEICSTLELIADKLPGPVPLETARRLRTILNPTWNSHVSFHEHALFPVLRRCHDGAGDLFDQLKQLELEHATIASAGHELIEQLGSIIKGEEPNPEMLGYMLRGVFAERRRHLQFEQRLLATSLPATLKPIDREYLRNWWSNHNWLVS